MRTRINADEGAWPLTDRIIYLDNAATSHPKPEPVYAAVIEALRAGGNPGRGGHRMALDAARRVMIAREAAARFFSAPDAGRVLFTASATDSLNLALKGLLRPGDHVITTAAEHNALRRPLTVLERAGVRVTRAPVSREGLVDPGILRAALRPNTRLIALAHASNVSGAVQPIEAIGAIARRAGVLLLVDAAQTGGVLPIAMTEVGIHLLAVPGHKGLMGPQGTGLLCVAPDVDLRPIREGGTGQQSEPAGQPAIFPEGFESGTLNVAGIVALAAGIAFLEAQRVETVRQREQQLTEALADGLRRLRGVTVYGPVDPRLRAAVVSFNIAGLDPAELEEELDEGYGVLGRAGLHCNPGAHAALGTQAQGGTMRFSPGFFTRDADVDSALAAVAEVAHRHALHA